MLADDERADLLGAVVQKVEMVDKNNVTLELLPIPTSHDTRFALETEMGARPDLVCTFNPQHQTEAIFIPPGGRLRKRVPRPYQDVVMIDHD